MDENAGFIHYNYIILSTTGGMQSKRLLAKNICSKFRFLSFEVVEIVVVVVGGGVGVLHTSRQKTMARFLHWHTAATDLRHHVSGEPQIQRSRFPGSQGSTP